MMTLHFIEGGNHNVPQLAPGYATLTYPSVSPAGIASFRPTENANENAVLAVCEANGWGLCSKNERLRPCAA